jgi:hypothetical protein
MLSPKLWGGFTSAVLQSNLERLYATDAFVTPALVGAADHLHLGALLLEQL